MGLIKKHKEFLNLNQFFPPKPHAVLTQYVKLCKLGSCGLKQEKSHDARKNMSNEIRLEANSQSLLHEN